MRTIDADALKEAIKEIVETEGKIDLKWSKGLNYSLKMIDNAPTVVAENATSDRPQGEWEIVDAEGTKIWNCVCTECGHDPQEYIGGSEDWWLRKTHLPNFCPNCGVRIVNVKGGAE